jgi:hypothetical protein
MLRREAEEDTLDKRLCLGGIKIDIHACFSVRAIEIYEKLSTWKEIRQLRLVLHYAMKKVHFCKRK